MRFFVCTYLGVLAGCNPIIFTLGEPSPPDSPQEQPWGEFAATLPVSECPTDSILEVNTTASELDGGPTLADVSAAGPTLSFAEALQIAANRAGVDTITFASSQFPVDKPATLALTDAVELPVPGPVCVDGRRRGVVLDWRQLQGPNPTVLAISAGSTLVGVQLRLAGDHELSLGGQMAGCLVDSNNLAARVFANAVVGPGNVFWGDGLALRVVDPARVEDNYFGYDPRTGTALGLNAGILAFSSVQIDENVFSGRVNFTVQSGGDGTVTLSGNRFGIDAEGAVLVRAEGAHLWLSGGAWRVGPNNIFTAAPAAFDISSPAEITQNKIYGNGVAMNFLSPAPASAEITSVASSGTNTLLVQGTCGAAGRVELFADHHNQGELYLAQVECDGITPWSLEVERPPRPYITVLLTSSGSTSGFSAAVAVP